MRDYDTFKRGAGASYLGLFFVTFVAIGGLAGNWLDQRFHRSPLFVIIGLALGMFGGSREMLKALKENTPPRPGSHPAAGIGSAARSARSQTPLELPDTGQLPNTASQPTDSGQRPEDPEPAKSADDDED